MHLSALFDSDEKESYVQVITGDSAAGEALVGSGIDKLFFTGSTEVGRKVAKRAGELLLPVELELGGKDAAIVCDDTNLLRASRIITRATFQNSGQNCIAVERIIVQDTIYDEFVDIMTDAVQELRQGDYRVRPDPLLFLFSLRFSVHDARFLMNQPTCYFLPLFSWLLR